MFYISYTFSTLTMFVVHFGDALELNLFIIFTRKFSFAPPPTPPLWTLLSNFPEGSMEDGGRCEVLPLSSD